MLAQHSHASPQHADIQIDAGATLHCVGVWRLQHLTSLERRLRTFSWPDAPELVWDASAIEAMDTAGAWLLQRTVNVLRHTGRQVKLSGLHPEHAELLKGVARDNREVRPAAPP